jgi:hypothetical protein
MQGHRLGVRLDPPKISEHMRESLRVVGYSDEAIDNLVAEGAVAACDATNAKHAEVGEPRADERLEQAAITASP